MRVQLASYLERGRLMWMIPLHLHVNQRSDYDDDYDCVDALRTSQLIFNHVGTFFPTPGLNLYYAEDKMSCSRTQHSASLDEDFGIWHKSRPF